jgi:hypothetical protein
MLFVTCLTLVPGLAFGQVTGTNTVGSGGDYADLSAAFADINAAGVSGSTVLEIISSFTESGTTPLSRTDLNGSNSLTIQPAAATTPTITFSNSAGLVINGSDNVTINGAAGGVGSTRDLSLVLQSSSAGSSVIYVQTASAAVSSFTLRNCIIGDATNTPDYALRIDGTPSFRVNDVLVDNNEIHGIGNAGAIILLDNIGATAVFPTNISRNTIVGDQNGSSQAFGINMVNCDGEVFIVKNHLNTLRTSSTSGGGIMGIRQDSDCSGVLRIYNNMIGGNFIGGSGPSRCHIIELNGTGNAFIYHNTLHLNSISVDFNSTGIALFSSGAIDIRNNIIINDVNDVDASCIYLDTFFTDPADLTSDYNNLYRSQTNGKIGYDGSTQYDPLSNWQSAFSPSFPDLNSTSVSVDFVSTTNLSLEGGSLGNANLKGTDLSANVVDDIFGTARLGDPDGPYKGAHEGSTPLPVQITSFVVRANRLDASLAWSTASETNNSGFEIERRAVLGSDSWAKVGFVQGAGTSMSPRSYSYEDRGLAPGRYAYRIKQVDNGGAFAYHSGAEVEVGIAARVFALEGNYPNPFNPETRIEFTVPERGRAILRIFNVIGQEVATLFNEEAEAGKIYQVRFDASRLPTGVYVSRLDHGGQSSMRKMLYVK